jgi:hypothetical protein
MSSPGFANVEGQLVTTSETVNEPQEISIQARLCNGSRLHQIGDLLTYRSGLWVVKGLFLGTTLSGERELYYILAEATASAQQSGDA